MRTMSHQRTKRLAKVKENMSAAYTEGTDGCHYVPVTNCLVFMELILGGTLSQPVVPFL